MYDTKFYNTSRQGMISSAEALVPILIEHVEGVMPYGRLIDVGCGEGWWANAFAEYGFDVLGLDGEWHGEHLLGNKFIIHDLGRPIDHPSLHRQFDVVVCLEVAEHLPQRRAASFIGDLCKLSNGGPIIFSAAIPGQGGTGHVNEQWPDYWDDLFVLHNYTANGDLRLRIWDDDRIENWYRQNLLIATPIPPDRMAPGPPLRLVHPVLYDARRTQ